MWFLTKIKNKINFNNFFKNIIEIKSEKKTLGRWSNENNIKTNLKVDYANEDHCGTCTGLLHLFTFQTPIIC